MGKSGEDVCSLSDVKIGLVSEFLNKWGIKSEFNNFERES